MELDELKDKWESMSNQLEKQQLLTDQLIMDLAKEKYDKKLKGIKGPELIGTVICGITVLLVLFNFQQLDTWYLQLAGLLLVIFLIMAPISSLETLNRLSKVDVSTTPVKESLEQFATSKKRFVNLQKIAFYMSFLMFFLSTLVAAKLMNGIDLIQEQPKALIYALPLGLLFVLVFSIFVFKKYKRSMSQAEELLKELD